MRDITIQEIFNELQTKYHYGLSSKQRALVRTFSEFHTASIPANELLRIISFYVNDGWKRTEINEGFFLVHQKSIPMADGKFTPEFRIQTHKKVILPGLVYFKSRESCNQALRIYKQFHSIFELY
jgi:hypothetical protein